MVTISKHEMLSMRPFQHITTQLTKIIGIATLSLFVSSCLQIEEGDLERAYVKQEADSENKKVQPIPKSTKKKTQTTSTNQTSVTLPEETDTDTSANEDDSPNSFVDAFTGGLGDFAQDIDTSSSNDTSTSTLTSIDTSSATSADTDTVTTTDTSTTTSEATDTNSDISTVTEAESSTSTETLIDVVEELPAVFQNAATLDESNPGSRTDENLDHYYQVEATDVSMSVQLEHTNPGVSTSNFSVIIYDSTQSQVDSFNALAGVDASSVIGVHKGATYYVQVLSNAAASTDNYQLHTSFSNECHEKEPNPDTSKATTLLSGIPCSGKKSDGDIQDTYQFTPNTSDVTLQVSNLAATGLLSIIIYDSAQNSLGNFNVTAGAVESISATLPAEQTYFFSIVLTQASTGDTYSIQASD